MTLMQCEPLIRGFGPERDPLGHGIWTVECACGWYSMTSYSTPSRARQAWVAHVEEQGVAT